MRLKTLNKAPLKRSMYEPPNITNWDNAKVCVRLGFKKRFQARVDNQIRVDRESCCQKTCNLRESNERACWR